MANPFVAEIRMFAGNFAPKGWATCDGQLLSISQNTALFSLLGTFYGGDGKSTFALPNLQDSTPIHQGQGPGLSFYDVGQSGGSSTETLIQSEMPAHTHVLGCDPAAGTQQGAANGLWAASAVGRSAPPYYSNLATNTIAMSGAALTVAGSGQPHNNR